MLLPSIDSPTMEMGKRSLSGRAADGYVRRKSACECVNRQHPSDPFSACVSVYLFMIKNYDIMEHFFTVTLGQSQARSANNIGTTALYHVAPCEAT